MAVSKMAFFVSWGLLATDTTEFCKSFRKILQDMMLQVLVDLVVTVDFLAAGSGGLFLLGVDASWLMILEY